MNNNMKDNHGADNHSIPFHIYLVADKLNFWTKKKRAECKGLRRPLPPGPLAPCAVSHQLWPFPRR